MVRDLNSYTSPCHVKGDPCKLMASVLPPCHLTCSTNPMLTNQKVLSFFPVVMTSCKLWCFCTAAQLMLAKLTKWNRIW